MRRPPRAEVLRTFGEAVRSARQRKDYSQEALSEAASVPLDQVVELERGARLPSPQIILRLAIALDTSPTVLCHRVQSINAGFERSVTHSRLLYSLYRVLRRAQ